MRMRFLILFIATIITALIYVSFDLIEIRGQSMHPTLSSGDLCVCVKANKINRGDIVAISYQNQYLAKRIIGLPGETVQVWHNGVVIIDKNNKTRVLQEKYIGKMNNPHIVKMKLKKDEYFFLGDNREISLDSPEIGPIKREQIKFKFLFSLTRVY